MVCLEFMGGPSDSEHDLYMKGADPNCGGPPLSTYDRLSYSSPDPAVA